MESRFHIHSSPNDLLRLKKALQLIRTLLLSYQNGFYDHVGFSCAVAAAKAEEIQGQVSKSCPVYPLFEDLTGVLKKLYEKKEKVHEAIEIVDRIASYFDLKRFHLVLK